MQVIIDSALIIMYNTLNSNPINNIHYSIYLSEDFPMFWVKIMQFAFEILLGTIKNEDTQAKYRDILITIAAQIVNMYGASAVNSKAVEIREI